MKKVHRIPLPNLILLLCLGGEFRPESSSLRPDHLLIVILKEHPPALPAILAQLRQRSGSIVKSWVRHIVI